MIKRTVHSILNENKNKSFVDWKRELRHHDITSTVVNLLEGIPQSTKYHPEVDALLHTFYVCKAVVALAREDLLETAFFHDVGKAFTTNVGDQRIYSFGHAIESVKFIDQPNVKTRLRDYNLVRNLTRVHMNEYGKKVKNNENVDDYDFHIFNNADKVLSQRLYEMDHPSFVLFINKLKEKWIHYHQRHSEKKLYMLVGISGSGKSTYLRNIDSKYVVSPDDIRREISGDVSSQVDNDLVWDMTKDRLRIHLARFGKAYLDATNVSRFLRIPFLGKFNDARKIAIVFDVDPEIAIERVRKDIDAKIDRSDVPESVIRRQYKNFKKGERSLDHEFNEIWKYGGEVSVFEKMKG